MWVGGRARGCEGPGIGKKKLVSGFLASEHPAVSLRSPNTGIVGFSAS